MTSQEIKSAVDAVCSMAGDFEKVTIRVAGVQTTIKMAEFVRLVQRNKMFDSDRMLLIIDHGTDCFIAGYSSVESINLS